MRNTPPSSGSKPERSVLDSGGDGEKSSIRPLAKINGVAESVYNISLNYLGVNPPLTPPVEGEDRVRREERRIDIIT
ncbi:hypothetical protein [Okeania sp. KiyG1]|uniref:hypothetical protein n=1 Tax=Okeania sp. KiyG1 TaxID=2720165 RepID=UPI001924ED83|nr:hypothetical protein [Okeania sp. KiyG1]GGA31250.1 hypothetical protein CYANOKiyG1_48000 [Okeania sp. KiyG1]